MELLLFGGSGHLGRDTVRAALAAGHRLRIASRSPPARDPGPGIRWHVADLSTGRGLEECVSGVEAIVFAAGNPRNHAAVEVEGMFELA